MAAIFFPVASDKSPPNVIIGERPKMDDKGSDFIQFDDKKSFTNLQAKYKNIHEATDCKLHPSLKSER